MRSILLGLFQVLNPPEPANTVTWLNTKGTSLFLHPEEVLFTEDWIKLTDGDAEDYIDWEELDFFYYPFVGINIKLPGYSKSRYFTVVVREEKEEDPLLTEFITRLRGFAGKKRSSGRAVRA